MCGIAGIISPDKSLINYDRLKKMTDAIAHRGPDGEAFWINNPGTVGFGHRRLCIIDLSPAAAQPMHYLNRYSIIHNGEIYNYVELRDELQKKGYSFRTQSDTEVILAAYDCYKAECLNLFDGMFAFAIWDEHEQCLFAARDRFGEKPFYYWHDEEKIIFGSEIKSLLANNVEKKINNKLLLNFIATGHGQHRAQDKETFYQKIYSLPPGHFLTVCTQHNLQIHITSYWNLDKKNTHDLPEKKAIELFADLFHTSIKRRLRSDVPLGTSLSGGLDSSSIVTAINEVDSKFSPATFTAVFPGFDKDESRFVELVTKSLNLKNYKVKLSVDDFITDFEKFINHHDEPISSASVYAQYKVFELAKHHNVTVLLDGQGADETLAGYHKYIHWYLQELLLTKPVKMFKEMRILKQHNIKFDWGIKNYIAAISPLKTALALKKRTIKKIHSNEDINREFATSHFNKLSIHKPVVSNLNDMLYFNTSVAGLDELLRYADRNSMAYGREVRLPFLNHKLVEFIFSLPSHFKIHEGYTKWILRKAMQQKLPAEIVWRKDKVGFEPPQKNWMQNKTLQDYIHEAKKTLVKEKILNNAVLVKKIQPHDAHAADNFDWRYLVTASLIR